MAIKVLRLSCRSSLWILERSRRRLRFERRRVPRSAVSMRVTPQHRLVWALLVTLGFSRHQYVHVSFSQKLDVVIDGLEEAWEFFGGVPLRVVVDNMKTAVVKSDRYEPILISALRSSQYAEHRGFVIDPAVARHSDGQADRRERRAVRSRELFPR